MQGTTVSTPKIDNNTISASNVKTLELSPTKKVKVDISTLPVVTTINGSEIKAYIEEVKSVNNSTKEVTTFYSPYMVFPNGEVTYMNGRRELLNSKELEENKKTWASTIQANKDAFIQAGLVNTKSQEETKPIIQNKGFNNYQYDTEMTVYGNTSTLDRIEGNTAIYKDKNGNDSIILAASSDNSYIGIFKDNTGNWSIKMENKDGNKNFKAQLKEAFDLLPVGAKIYEHTSISVDGLRVFAQQLNHGFSLSNETYEVKVNAGDRNNVFGVNDNSDMPLLGQGVKPMKEVRQILKPYLDKFGVSTRDVFSEKDAKSGENIIGISNMPMLIKTGIQIESKPDNTTPINVVDTSKATIMIGESDTTPIGPQSAEEDLLKAMSLLNTYNKEAPDGTLGKEEIKPRTDIEEQTGRNADNNIVVDNPEALKKWNELSDDTRELLRLKNVNETYWNSILPKQREAELNCLS